MRKQKHIPKTVEKESLHIVFFFFEFTGKLLGFISTVRKIEILSPNHRYPGRNHLVSVYQGAEREISHTG